MNIIWSNINLNDWGKIFVINFEWKFEAQKLSYGMMEAKLFVSNPQFQLCCFSGTTALASLSHHKSIPTVTQMESEILEEPEKKKFFKK